MPILLFPHFDPVRYTSSIVSVPKSTLWRRAANSLIPNTLKEDDIKNVFRISRLYINPVGRTGIPFSMRDIAAMELIDSSSQKDWAPRSYILRRKPAANKKIIGR